MLPLPTPDWLLLTATARAGNSAQVWNERHAMFDMWGIAPTWIEPVRGWLTLKDLDGALAVTATPLDDAGKPNGPDIKGRMLEDGRALPAPRLPLPPGGSVLPFEIAQNRPFRITPTNNLNSYNSII
ncbi:hypothetical protein ASE85_20605 [Sphingobium sp. Leaf26]|uniref:hypothetical protein n=1 Tax=Sphingobium sp. Leaf26 TaxID=1735693 RepID=UPI0006FA0E43|nr:hypothetical protein [Sphingobium sp. Leaf26]KQN05143.1 hypothetical protein ASE85_20605 [Sphingobium sp. Leaf26]